MIEKIDSYLLFIIAAFAIPYVILFITKEKSKRRVWNVLFKIMDVLVHLMYVTIISYVIWRTFFAIY